MRPAISAGGWLGWTSHDRPPCLWNLRNLPPPGKASRTPPRSLYISATRDFNPRFWEASNQLDQLLINGGYAPFILHARNSEKRFKWYGWCFRTLQVGKNAWCLYHFDTILYVWWEENPTWYSPRCLPSTAQMMPDVSVKNINTHGLKVDPVDGFWEHAICDHSKSNIFKCGTISSSISRVQNSLIELSQSHCVVKKCNIKDILISSIAAFMKGLGCHLDYISSWGRTKTYLWHFQEPNQMTVKF